MPVWFRRGLIVVAALLMCSCRAIEPAAYGQTTDCYCEPEACQECEGCLVCPMPLGPADEYLCDGGDRGPAVGVTHDDRMVGLEQEDTVGQYTTRDGRTIVAPSSRVCIYAPRFGSVRRVVHPMGAEQRLFVDALGDTFTPAEAGRTEPTSVNLQNVSLTEQAGEQPASLFRGRQQPGEGVMRLMAAETIGLVGPYSNLSLMTLGQIDVNQTALIGRHSLAAVTWAGDQEVQITVSGQAASAIFSAKQPGLIYQTDEPNRPKLRIVKLASADSAHPGDEVTFTLRFDNIGDAPIRDVVIVDNLTARLAYVDGTAESSVDAGFSTTRNEVGSLLLRWELSDPIGPGEGGVLTFRTRVR